MKRRRSGGAAKGTQSGGEEPAGESPVSRSLDENLSTVRELLGRSDDIVFREFRIGREQQIRAALVYVDGIIDRVTVHEHIMKSLMLHTERIFPAPPSGKGLGEAIEQSALTVGEVKQSTKLGDAIDGILNSDTALFVDGVPVCYIVNTRSWEHRTVQEPGIEAVVRGPREGFNEVMRVTTALIRRRIKDTRLRVKMVKVGRRSKTDVAVMYIEGVANPGLVEEVFARLKDIDVDGVLDSGYIEQMIEDNPASPFPQVHATERADKAAAALLSGKVAIAADGSPFVLMVPGTFWGFFQAAEDYYERWTIATFVRFLRLAAIFVALVLPAFYVALLSFHPEMLPSSLAFSLAGITAGVPFPVVVEVLIMELSVEALREASVRLPGPIGPTVGIVGAIVLGEAAVRARLVSSLTVIIVAMTTIASFASPNYSVAIAIRILRFPLVALGGTLGLFGVMIGLLAISIHVVGLDSFGYPYLAPTWPTTTSDLKDTVVRVPLWAMKRRPLYLRPGDLTRMGDETSAVETGKATRGVNLAPPGEGQDDGGRNGGRDGPGRR